MLRAKSGTQTFTVVDKETGISQRINKSEYLTAKQIRSLNTKPDFIWQFSQYLKKHYAAQGKDIAVYVKGAVSVNGKPRQALVNDTLDLASVKWQHFKHNDWLLPSKN